MKEYIKSHFPRLKFFLAFIRDKAFSVFGKISFAIAKVTGRPYFGYVFGAKQGSFFRYPAMRAFLKERIVPGCQFLEIGSWAGGSALVWAEEVEKVGGKVFCVDHWQTVSDSPSEMLRAVKDDGIFKLFLHNTKAHKDTIVIRKGDSNDILPMLPEKNFDFVYIDGDHHYTQFVRDLKNAIRLVKPGGYICGDDYEIPFSEIDASHATANKENDFIKDPKSGGFFHPGVAVGIHELLGAVESNNGFWWSKR